jgi:hypothetical protein
MALAAFLALVLFACGEKLASRANAADHSATFARTSSGAWMTLGLTSGSADSLFHIRGGGFQPDYAVGLCWDGGTNHSICLGMGGPPADANGEFDVIAGPPCPAVGGAICLGPHQFCALQGLSRACLVFTVTSAPRHGCPDPNAPTSSSSAEVWLGHNTGSASTYLTVTGTGFPSGQASLRGYSNDANGYGLGFFYGPGISNAAGTFCIFTYVPQNAQTGPYKICATIAAVTACKPFDVVQPSPVP